MAQFIIGIIIVVLGVILTTVGGYVAKDGWEKMHHKDNNKKSIDISQIATGNDNTQAATTGDNSPIVGGDYVEGDKIVNQKLSESDKEEIVKRIAERLEPQLSKQYSGAHTVFGITRDGLVVPGGLVSENIKVFWDTGKVHSISDDKVLITIPDIIPYNGMLIKGTITPLARRLGAKSGPLISVGGVSPIVEIIGIQGDLVVVALGFEAKKEAQ